MARRQEKPDLSGIDAGLKDFQRRTAAAAFRRLFLDQDSSHRFLVADEVGLGKTLIARSVIAQTLEHLWDRVDRIDVVYICSNADIARQNIRRLNVMGRDSFSLATRITLLPTRLADLSKNKVNFVSFTPATSFDLKSHMGQQQERMLLYCLLEKAWNFSGTAPMNVFQGTVRNTQHFRKRLREFTHWFPIDRALANQFRKAIAETCREQRGRGEEDLRRRFKRICSHYQRSDSRVDQEIKKERSRFLGELRALLAKVCIQGLEPDLVILDEFQRFKSILHGEDDVAELARRLFEFSDAQTAVRVLLLSATPYKMYTLAEEAAEDDHYKDFIETIRFLVRDEGRTAEFQALLREYRCALLRLNSSDAKPLEELKNALERRLRRVMARTERLAATLDRGGMLTQMAPDDVRLRAGDVLAYTELQRVARRLDMHDTVEYWKSSPYVLNFMEDYKLKRALHEQLDSDTGHSDLSDLLRSARHLMLSWQDIENYRGLDPRNARLRGLLAQTIDRGLWQLLWLPPSLPYYALEGPFAELAGQSLTKRLVFSRWRVVPKVIASVLSYEAERHAFRSFDADALNTEAERERRSGTLLLRFNLTDGRPTGMPVLALMYPSVTLARHCDPLRLARGSHVTTLTELRAAIRADLTERLPALAQSAEQSESRADEQWYWAAPMLLDQGRDRESVEEWFDRTDLAAIWSRAGDAEADAAWRAHVERVRELLAGNLVLGRQPDDLADVVADLAVAGPAVVALRSFSRLLGVESIDDPNVRDAAAQIGWSFRTLFNRPEVVALLRGLKQVEPYWHRVLDYCAEGCLQSVMDEYMHVLKDALALVDPPPGTLASELAGAVDKAIAVNVSVLRVDDIQIDDGGRASLHQRSLTARFALPFGQQERTDDGETVASRGEKVRDAFNSPFWPFVVASTSIGQEGLDFHWYCHAVVHWNLPSNPVDLEQREGRVHRYKGHAVRKNLAQTYRHQVFEATERDTWDTLFQLGRDDRPADTNDLVPFWLYPIDGGARIERHVPALPLTRDRQVLEALRRSLAVYRMVFGQPRQEDLMEYLLNHVSEQDRAELAHRLTINLSP
jgi:hypothetical protein